MTLLANVDRVVSWDICSLLFPAEVPNLSNFSLTSFEIRVENGKTESKITITTLLFYQTVVVNTMMVEISHMLSQKILKITVTQGHVGSRRGLSQDSARDRSVVRGSKLPFQRKRASCF